MNARVLAGGAMLPGYAAWRNMWRMAQPGRSRTKRPAATSARSSAVQGNTDMPVPWITSRNSASLLATVMEPRVFTRALRSPRWSSSVRASEPQRARWLCASGASAHHRRLSASANRVRQSARIAKAGVKRVVNLSGIGAHVSAGAGPIVGLHRQEQRLNAIADLDVLHVRPGYFFENHLAYVQADSDDTRAPCSNRRTCQAQIDECWLLTDRSLLLRCRARSCTPSDPQKLWATLWISW